MSNIKCYQVIALWKFDVDIICLQQKLIVLVKQGWNIPLSKVFACINLSFIYFFTSSKLTEIFVSFRGNIKSILKISVNLDSICKVCQILLIMRLTSVSFVKGYNQSYFWIVLCWIFIHGNNNSFVDVDMISVLL